MIARRYIQTTDPYFLAELAIIHADENAAREAFFAAWEPITGINGMVRDNWRVEVPDRMNLPEGLRVAKDQREGSYVTPDKKTQRGLDLIAAIRERQASGHPIARFGKAHGFPTFAWDVMAGCTGDLGGMSSTGRILLSLPFKSPEAAAAFVVPDGWSVIEQYEFEAAFRGTSSATYEDA